jgi:hypothetical protein
MVRAMNTPDAWTAAVATVALLAAYELLLLLVERWRPRALARSAHVGLRLDWFRAASRQPGSELMAVQLLRNAVMAATLSASTAALALVAASTLAAPSLRVFNDGLTAATLTPRLLLEAVLLVQLFASLLCSVMAVRYYNHAGFIAAMPVGSAERLAWEPVGAGYLRRAGLLYSWGLRQLPMVAPTVVAVLHAPLGPGAALAVIGLLLVLDRFGGARG